MEINSFADFVGQERIKDYFADAAKNGRAGRRFRARRPPDGTSGMCRSVSVRPRPKDGLIPEGSVRFWCYVSHIQLFAGFKSFTKVFNIGCKMGKNHQIGTKGGCRAEMSVL